MNPILRLALFLSLSWFLLAAAVRADDTALVTAAHRAPPDSADHRKYAPDRDVDVMHLLLDVTPDFKQRSVAGQVTITFKPNVRPLRELSLDAVDLTITNVTATATVQGWQNTGKKLVITFSQPVAPDQETKVTVTYSAEPKQGLYFRTPEQGYRPGETHVFSQGEPIEARQWFPCVDAPNEKSTTEMICHVPEDMTVLSNGRPMGETREANGMKAVRWLQDKPHSNYLIALVAGYFRSVEDKHGEIPLRFYTLPSAIGEAPGSFRDTKDMMAFFEKETGVPYPWAGYNQACVNDFVAGGMENTTLTILTDSTLFPASTEPIRSSLGLVAHELAHMWFGDLVTCKDWSHLWLNEGFATYYEALYDGYKNGNDAFLFNLYNAAKGVLDVPNDTKPIVDRKFDHPNEQFSYLAYPKGAWVLHMLRSQLGPDLYRRCVQTYLERHRFGNVVTEDLNAVFEELSGRSLDRYFDQWVYHAHHPELDIQYSWDETAHLAKLSVRQTQALSDQVSLFRFPLPVRFLLPSGVTDQTITVKEKEEDFSFALPEAPRLVRVDPELTVLAKIRFQPPGPMVAVMLTNSTDMLGRLQAVGMYSGRKEKDLVSRLARVLNEDPFYAVRIEASHALRASRTEEAFAALLAGTNQPDGRVRQQVWADIGAFYREATCNAIRGALPGEQNPDIQTVMIRALGAYPQPEVRTILTEYLRSDSYENMLADAALDALKAQDDPAVLPAVLEVLGQREAKFTGGGFANGLAVAAHLARNETNKEPVRELLLKQLNHSRRATRRAAIAALGDLGDPKAIAPLDTFMRGAKEDQERQTAQQAISTLRAGRKPVDDLRDLRNEVMSLQKENRELQKNLDDLKKKVGELTSEKAEKPAEKDKEKAAKRRK